MIQAFICAGKCYSGPCLSFWPQPATRKPTVVRVHITSDQCWYLRLGSLFYCEELFHLAATNHLGYVVELAAKHIIVCLHVCIDYTQRHDCAPILECYTEPALGC